MDSKKWGTERHPDPNCPATAVVADGDDFCLGAAMCFSSDAPEMARRIAACLNACASVTTEDLEIIADASDKFAMVRGRFVDERDEILAALEKYEAAHSDLFGQCCSNPVTNAWGEKVNMTLLNEAHVAGSSVIARAKGRPS